MSADGSQTETAMNLMHSFKLTNNR